MGSIEANSGSTYVKHTIVVEVSFELRLLVNSFIISCSRAVILLCWEYSCIIIRCLLLKYRGADIFTGLERF